MVSRTDFVVLMLVILTAVNVEGLCRFDKDGSVLLLHLDKAAGTKVKDGEKLTDESGQGQEVKVRGTTAEYRDTHQGAKGLYLGDEDYISVRDSASLDLTSVFTIEITVRAENDYVDHILQKDLAYGLLLRKDELTLSLISDTKKSERFTVKSSVVQPRKIQYFAATFDGQRARLYLDGKLLASPVARQQFGVQKSAGELRIGRNVDPAKIQNFRGMIYSVRLSNRVRTCVEIQRNQFCNEPTKVDACCDKPCENNGTCTDDPGPNFSKYQCACVDGYSGNRCEIGSCGKCCEDYGDPFWVWVCLAIIIFLLFIVIVLFLVCCQERRKAAKEDDNQSTTAPPTEVAQAASE